MEDNKSTRRKQAIEVITGKPGISCPELAKELGISVDNASMLLLAMKSAGQVKRDGKRRQYRYSLPE